MARRRRTGSERSDLSLVLTAVVVGCWPRGAGGARLRGRGWSPAPHLCTAVSVSAQAPVGALAIDERQGGPVMLGGVDVRPLCGLRGGPGRRQHGGGLGGIILIRRPGLGRRRCRNAAPAAAVRVARSGCGGCNGPVVEEELGLNQAARRQIQQGLRSAGFDPGAADGLFGPRTRTAIGRCERDCRRALRDGDGRLSIPGTGRSWGTCTGAMQSL